MCEFNLAMNVHYFGYTTKKMGDHNLWGVYQENVKMGLGVSNRREASDINGATPSSFALCPYNIIPTVPHKALNVCTATAFSGFPLLSVKMALVRPLRVSF